MIVVAAIILPLIECLKILGLSSSRYFSRRCLGAGCDLEDHSDYLFFQDLISIAVLEKHGNLYFQQHNEVMPHAEFNALHLRRFIVSSGMN